MNLVPFSRRNRNQVLGAIVMISPGRFDRDVTLEMTPLIDMVFLLLIFFLVATTFHETEREMRVALPQAAFSGPISAALRDIVVNVDSEGDIFAGGRKLSPGDLKALIDAAVAANPAQKVTVRGDRSTAYANVAAVLDICKGGGVQEPFLDTVPGRFEAGP